MKKYAIIVAGGEGRRVGTDIPKQFIKLCGKPMLYHTMKAFYNEDTNTELLVVLHPEFLEEWEEYMRNLPESEQIPFKAICGGMSRTHSVYNGLYELRNERTDVVAIHDAARPLLSEEMLERGWDIAMTFGIAVPVIDEVNSLRMMLPNGKNKAVDRSKYKVVQTPQIFQIGPLLDAYAKAGITLDTISKPGPLHSKYTDDASVMEAVGYSIALYQGDPSNIKVTNPIDLKVAEYMLQQL